MEHEDNWKEHMANFHTTFQENCSECYKENRLIQTHRTVNRFLPYEDGELHNPYGDNYPLGYVPE